MILHGQPVQQSAPKNQASADSGGSKDLKSLPDVIGLPPSSASGIAETDNLLYNSFLMIDIMPCKPEFQKGISLFKLNSDKGWDEYKKLLGEHSVSVSSECNLKKGIRIAAIAEGFPTDTFTNEYGESFLNKIADVAGGAFGEASQIIGTKKGSDTVENIGKGISSMGGLAGSIGSGIEDAGKYLGGLSEKMRASGSNTIAGMADAADALLAGARIDFPMVWKNSSYNSSFSFNIKLYNPNPASNDATNKYIIGPLASLLVLALPVSDDKGVGYNYPFFCKVNCPGLFRIHAGAITSISVNKGGDQGQVAFNQRMGMVDVRIDFINLHNSMVISQFSSERPTLKSYLDNLRDSMTLRNIYRKEDYKNKPTASEQEKIPEQVGGPGSPGMPTSDADTGAPPRRSQEQIDMEAGLMTDYR